MIPKRIHYCWFSGDPYTETVERCMATWRKYMPEYEFVKWDMDRIKEIDSVWLKECLEVKKWAFAADFVRLWAVFHEGGIYLDSDVLIFDSLDAFLKEKMFIGREATYYPTFENGVKVFLTSHCFGAEAGHPFLKLCLEYYQNRHFICSTSINIPNELRYDMLMMPYIQSHLAERFGYDARINADNKQLLSNGVAVYPSRFFGGCWTPGTPLKSYAHHLGAGGWREPNYKPTVAPPVKYTLGYKIRWRILYYIEKLLARYNYLLVKLPCQEEKKK